MASTWHLRGTRVFETRVPRRHRVELCHMRTLKPSLRGSIYGLKIEPQRLDLLKRNIVYKLALLTKYFGFYGCLPMLAFFPSAQMAEWPLPFISFTFSSFLPFTLFSSNHNQCKPLTLTSTKSLFFSSAMTEWVLLLLLSFLSSFSVSNTPKPTNHADFCTTWRKVEKHEDMLI